MVRELGNSAREQQVIGKREREKKEVRERHGDRDRPPGSYSLEAF